VAGAAGEAGSAGQAGGNQAGSAGQAGGPGFVGLLIDDFEDGDGQSLLGTGWYGYTDAGNGGDSTLTFTGATGSAVAMGGPGYASTKSLEVSYSLDKGTYTYDPFVGFGVSLAAGNANFDASGYEGIGYVYRGAAHTVRLETSDVTDYDYYGVPVAASADWKTVMLPFAQFAQGGWGTKVPLDTTHARVVSFHMVGSTGSQATLDIDDLTFVTDIPKGPPDWTILPPQPPADTELASLEITNPLQAQAEATLSKGYNITNWLESDKFVDFSTYNESYVQNLAAAGFKALRLPIDLDRYVTATTGSGDTLDVTLDSDLFLILDSFDTWTQDSGLSLTIDYHQYDRSLDMTDADSAALTVVLWKKVAEHFASSPRTDLYYELLNEPALSVTGTISAAQWDTLANSMIAAIRSVDSTHTLIFGDTSWYDIDQLVKREPLADTNVIYAIHDYDPFLFTHQGASWADMGSTHDVPYPYSEARWSEYSSDLGFTSTMPAWILGSAQGYYRTGTHSAVRNHIVAAKAWAVEHNVPIICNEFGAYDGSSRLEDRVNYYTDVIGVFNELHIPWQHWFMVMDEAGNVNPDIAAAMGL